MLPLLSDEDVPRGIVDGLRRSVPGIDVVRVQEVGLMHTPDPDILEWASRQRRAIFSRDRNTMRGHTEERLRQGQHMAGLVILDQFISIGKAVSALAVYAQAGDPGDLDGQILFIS
jgi:hypothetical protein